MVKKTIIIAAVFIGIILCAVGYSDSRYRTATGRQAPALQLPAQSTGAPATSLNDNRGRYVLLNFWSSTDPASRKAANRYTAWLRKHPESNLRLLSINMDEHSELFNQIVRRDSLIPSTQYHLSGDTARAVSDCYGLKDGLGSVLISPTGKIISHNPVL